MVFGVVDVKNHILMSKCLIHMPLLIAPLLQKPFIFRRIENAKKRNYEARIREMEHGTFTPLVFSGTG